MFHKYFHFSRKQLNGIWVLLACSQFLLTGSFFLSAPSTYTEKHRLADQYLLDSLYQQWQDSLKAERKRSWEQKKQAKWKSGKAKSQGQSSAATDSPQHSPSSYTSKRHYKKPKPKKIRRFDISRADTTQLQQIRGIGSKLSLRIIKFRDKLGGFYRLEQLKEVYGLKPEVVDRLLSTCYLLDSSVVQIPINTASEKELAAHPYISYKLASVIVNYRHAHGPYRSENDLAKIRMLATPERKKLVPYISWKD